MKFMIINKCSFGLFYDLEKVFSILNYTLSAGAIKYADCNYTEK